MVDIQKKLTIVNRTIANSRKIKYIVIHYVGAVSSAKNNVDYLYNVDRQKSAHYFVDENSIWQCVDDSNIAWHCGGAKIYYSDCRNSNSIGIELCCKKDKDGKWYFESQTLNNAIELVQYLMKLHGIKIENVIRHYDVTHKVCPKPFILNEQAWNKFKERIAMKEITDLKEAMDYLEEHGRMLNRAYWEKTVITTRNVDSALIKWANDAKKADLNENK